MWALCCNTVPQKVGKARVPNVKLKHRLLSDLFIHHSEMKKERRIFPPLLDTSKSREQLGYCYFSSSLLPPSDDNAAHF